MIVDGSVRSSSGSNHGLTHFPRGRTVDRIRACWPRDELTALLSFSNKREHGMEPYLCSKNK
jgi:hypothetical protein